MSYLKSFNLTINCIGPIFIGSDEKRLPTEYIITDKKVYFPDMESVYTAIIEKGREEKFKKFVLEREGSLNNLCSGEEGVGYIHGGYWCDRDEELPKSGPRIKPSSNANNSRSRQSFKSNKNDDKSKSSLNEIHMFIKDAYGKPYIPGTSIKGLIRSLYLQSIDWPESLEPFNVSKVQGRKDGKEAQRIENAILRKNNRTGTRQYDAVNDLFQAIRVSDSIPLNTKDLVLCQKVDVNSEGIESGISLFRECLKPGSRITSRITVDTSKMKNGGWPDAEEYIENLSKHATKVYENRFQPYINKYQHIASANSDSYVYFGGGAGFRSKTFVQDSRDIAKILEGQFGGNHKGAHFHDKTFREKKVAPIALKMTKVGGQLFEMGKCKLEVERINND